MKVTELSPNELEELRSSRCFELFDEGKLDRYDDPDQITDKQLFEHYANIDFVPDDFFCNQPDYIVEV